MTDIGLAREICGEICAKYQEPVLRFTLEPGEGGPLDSKVKGTPYLPREMEWPLDSKGAPLELLAQVNCSELSGLPDFPHAGLLQFFTGTDDLYGADFDDMTTPRDFRVLYHETPDFSVTMEELAAKQPPYPEDACSPLGDCPCLIRFAAPSVQGMTEGDYRFEKSFLQMWNRRRPDAPLKNLWDFYKRLPDGEKDISLFPDSGQKGPWHQLGGYPFFTQSDPRGYAGRYTDLDVVLFQLDSDMRERKDLVLWGDCGVSNFFISRQALRNRDFSQVGYNWDCF